MTLKVISFLGYTPPNRPYIETTYRFGEDSCRSPFMTEAVARIFRPDQLLVLVTSEAKKQNFAELERRLGNAFTPTPLDIKQGRNETELWDIFAVIAEAINPDDTIVFDITNAFRSLPILVFLAASYVRVVKQAFVTKLVYGAFNPEAPDQTPILELSPFVRLLDWVTATDAFLKSGRGDDLAQLIRNTSPTSLGSPQAVDEIATTLQTLTTALRTIRPTEVMQTAEGLDKEIENVRKALPVSAQPFGLLLDQMKVEYGHFGLAKPTAKAFAHEVIAKQLEMILWYRDKGLLVQAVTLAREWVVSLVLTEAGGELFDERQRKDSEDALNGYNSPIDIRRIRKFARMLPIWQDIRNLRNDLDHAGMRRRPQKASDVAGRVETVCRQLQLLMK